MRLCDGCVAAIPVCVEIALVVTVYKGCNTATIGAAGVVLVVVGIGRDVEVATCICCLQCYLGCIVVVALVQEFVCLLDKCLECALVVLYCVRKVDNNLVTGVRCNLVAGESTVNDFFAQCNCCAINCNGCCREACAFNVAGLSLVVGDSYFLCLVAFPYNVYGEVTDSLEALYTTFVPLSGEGGENVNYLGVALQQHLVDTRCCTKVTIDLEGCV